MSGQVRVHDLSRGSSLPLGLSSSVALAIGAANVLDVHNAKEAVITNAAATIKVIKSVRAVGEILVIRAEVNGVKFEQDSAGGTNIFVPGKTLTMEAGDVIMSMKTDRGPLTEVLMKAPRISPVFTAVENLNAKFESAAGSALPELPIKWGLDPYSGAVIFQGGAKVKAAEEIAANAIFFELPAAARPASLRRRLVANATKFAAVDVEGNGKVVAKTALPAATVVDFSALTYALTP